jgi:hypothetical protein
MEMDGTSTLELPAELAKVSIKDFPDRIKSLPLSPAQRQIVADVPGLIREQPQATFLARVESVIKADDTEPHDEADANQTARRLALRTWWYFGQGLDAGGSRQMEEALRCYRRAAYGFVLLGDDENAAEAIEAGIESEAMWRIQQRDFVAGDGLLAQVRQFLESSARMGPEQREALANLTVESLYQQSIQAFRNGDQVQAEQLLRRAAERLTDLAKYHDDGDPFQRLYTGQAGLFQAQAAFLSGLRAISLYDFDDVDEGESTAAAKAAELLAERSPPNAAMAKFYAEILEILEKLAKIMLRVMSSAFHNERGEFRKLHESLRAARKVIPAAAGADPVLLAAGCDQLNQWLNNLERLAKPSRKDLGVYGGSVACVAFCGLLIVVAIINRTFNLGASATSIFAVCGPLAAAAGFGLAGLKAMRSGGSGDRAAPSDSKN